jgi:hypothetical protein
MALFYKHEVTVAENDNILAMLFQNDTYELHLLFLIIQQPQIINTQNKNYCFFFSFFEEKLNSNQNSFQRQSFFFFSSGNDGIFSEIIFSPAEGLLNLRKLVSTRGFHRKFFRPRRDN